MVSVHQKPNQSWWVAQEGAKLLYERVCVGGCVDVCASRGQVPPEMNSTICDRNTSSHYVNCKGPPVQKPVLWQGGICSNSSKL